MAMPESGEFFESPRGHILLIVGGVLVVAVAAYGFFLRPKKPASSTATVATKNATGTTGATVAGPTIEYVPVNTATVGTSSTTNSQTAAPPPATTTPDTVTVPTATTTTTVPTTTTTTTVQSVVPPMTVSTPSALGITYTVRIGDSLSEIASHYQTTWQAIYAANKALIDQQAGSHGITTAQYNWIYPGETLSIP